MVEKTNGEILELKYFVSHVFFNFDVAETSRLVGCFVQRDTNIFDGAAFSEMVLDVFFCRIVRQIANEKGVTLKFLFFPLVGVGLFFFFTLTNNFFRSFPFRLFNFFFDFL